MPQKQQYHNLLWSKSLLEKAGDLSRCITHISKMSGVMFHYVYKEKKSPFQHLSSLILGAKFTWLVKITRNCSACASRRLKIDNPASRGFHSLNQNNIHVHLSCKHFIDSFSNVLFCWLTSTAIFPSSFMWQSFRYLRAFHNPKCQYLILKAQNDTNACKQKPPQIS